MNTKKHRDGTISITLSHEEAERVFRLVRAGRRSLNANETNEHQDTGFAIDLMNAIDRVACVG